MPYSCFNTRTISALFIALAIGLGAIGAHLLKGILEPKDLEIYQTAVFYHLFNSLGALLVVALSQNLLTEKKARRISSFLLIGVTIFSGSLYMLVATNARWLGAITPIGGIILILTWIWLATELGKTKTSHI